MSAAVTERSSGALWLQIQKAMSWARIAAIIFSLVFLALIVGQVAQLYQVAAAVNPALGYAWLFTAGVLLSLIAVPAYRFLSVPKVALPPIIPDAANVTLKDLRSEARYLDVYLANLARNVELTDKLPEITRARAELIGLTTQIRQASIDQVKDLDAALMKWSSATVTPILRDLDKKADRLIFQEGLSVGLATAISPNGTLDAFVMLWRSVQLSSELAKLYYGRPGFWGTLDVCRDVAVATAVAGYMQNISDSLGQLVTNGVGGVSGVVAGPAMDGILNALVLSRIGYLTQQRCRSFREWDTNGRKSAMSSALGSTRKIAVGLTTELLRQVGAGVGAAVGSAAKGVAHAAGATAETAATAATAAAEKVVQVAGVAKTVATELGASVMSYFRKKDE